MGRKVKRTRDPKPTGIQKIDCLSDKSPCSIEDYINGASAYVLEHHRLGSGAKKRSQLRLSSVLARAFADELAKRIPDIRPRLCTEEKKVAGGLRTMKADVSESHELDGLRLAVELKPINLAVGRAIWNRFGDIRTFAVNVHLKFPFCVVGGVLTIPTFEFKNSKSGYKSQESTMAFGSVEDQCDLVVADMQRPERYDSGRFVSKGRKSTVKLIRRAIERLIRAGGRKSEAEAAHLLEGIAVVVYDPDTATIDPELPMIGQGLRWEEFIDNIEGAYRARYED